MSQLFPTEEGNTQGVTISGQSTLMNMTLDGWNGFKGTTADQTVFQWENSL